MKTSALQKIRESRFGTRVFYLLLKFHILTPALRYVHRDDIRKSKLFFADISERVLAVCELLQDDRSRAVFRDAIRYRQSDARRDAPACTLGQYFPDDVVRLTNHEVFIDCCAFTGDTVRPFVEKSRNQYRRIVCFEPDPSNFEQLAAACTDSRIVKVQAGVWSETTTLKFRNNKGSGSKVASMESDDIVSVPVVSIDEVPECQDATFIKMDIEGSEMNALLGAMKVIRRNRPILAICIYHSGEDMLRIPEYLGAALDHYSFHVRHHSRNWQETVLYAIPK